MLEQYGLSHGAGQEDIDNRKRTWSHGNLEKVQAARAAYEKRHKKKDALV